jgi:hypothetical protein
MTLHVKQAQPRVRPWLTLTQRQREESQSEERGLRLSRCVNELGKDSSGETMMLPAECSVTSGKYFNLMGPEHSTC